MSVGNMDLTISGKSDSPRVEPSLHVYSVPRDNHLDTPDSVVSTGSLTLLNADGHTRFFNAGNLQQSYTRRQAKLATKNDNSPSDNWTDAPYNKTTNQYEESGENNAMQSKSSNNFMLGKSMRTQLRKENSSSRVHEERSNRIQNLTQNEDISKRPVQDKMKKEGISCLLKFVLFCVLVLLLVAGIVVLIYFKKEPVSDKRTGSIIPNTTEKPKRTDKEICSDVSLKLREQISFTCSIVAANKNPYHVTLIKVTPPIYWNEGKTFQIDIANQTNEWRADIDLEHRTLTINGSKATCSSDGKFALEFYDGTKIKVNTSVHIHVISEVSRVNVSLSQDMGENSDDFVLGCSTNSGCEHSMVDFFSEIDDVEHRLRKFEFSCTITYDDFHGYNVACTGTIPDYLLAKFQKITCRPRSPILDIKDEEDKSVEIELPECDLTKHCGYQCKDNTDYYVVSSGRCDIFHRCYSNQPFTSYCAPGTFFDPVVCACRHTRDLPWCQRNGALIPNSDVKDKTCTASDVNN